MIQGFDVDESRAWSERDWVHWMTSVLFVVSHAGLSVRLVVVFVAVAV